MGKIVDYVYNSTLEYVESMPKNKRKHMGQFFTTKETAVFMADLFFIHSEKKEIFILDPGVGSGILSAALIEKIVNFTNIEKITLHCYETDANILNLLNNNLVWISQKLDIQIEYKIIAENYLLSQIDDFQQTCFANIDPIKYDIVIGNPPYLKINKEAQEAKAMALVCHGAPNLYFLFATMSLFNLKENGEMVYIIPRSWTSGAYFKKFREYLFSNGCLEHVHLFISRDKVFKDENVLQETIIIKVKKNHTPPTEIKVTTSNSYIDFNNKSVINVPYNTIVSSNNSYVYLVTSSEEIDTLHKLNSWTNTLPSLGLKMKTGLTVDFRNKECLRNIADEQSVPLFYSHNIKDGKISFPTGRESEFICTEQNSLLQKNCNYLFVKRFTSKEEKRRLQCAIYLSRKFSQFSSISTQNKINFITGLQELSECVVYGLYVLFNSSIYDLYYRILNGSTQVNSTEINNMPMPTLNIIESMGKELIKRHDMSELTCNQILGSYV